MSDTGYLYLIKTIDDNKIKLTTELEIIDGVTLSEGQICAVIKRYSPPVDMSMALADIKKSQELVPPIVKQAGRKTGKIYTDHVGNEFDTVFQMCAYYKISESKYRSRLTGGWSQEEALTGVRKNKQISDHQGNVFDSKAEMCQHYGVREATFNARRKAGKSLEEALVGIDNNSASSVKDHLGNTYKNISQMCKAYGVQLDSFCHRKERGWTLEEILTGKRKTEPVFDHKGISYPDLNEMCLEYNIKKSNYLNRIKYGWTVEEALTGVKKDAVILDHLGNIFLTQKEMCDYYGISSGTFKARMNRGATLEEALTLELGVKRNNPKKTVSDHLGQAYPTTKEMCIAYNVHPSTYYDRIRNGYTTEEALTGDKKKVTPPQATDNAPPKKTSPIKEIATPVTDHLGNAYPSTSEMCRAYGIRFDTFKARLTSGKSLEEALTRIPSYTTSIPCQDHLGNHYNSQIEMARTYGLTKDQFIARRRLGWDLERILTTPVGNGANNQAFVFNGTSYTSKRDFCRKNGLNYDVFIHRTNAGMSFEEAVAAAIKSKNRPRLDPVDHKNNRYTSIKEMCEAYGVSVNTLTYRLKHNWTLEDALTKSKKTSTS